MHQEREHPKRVVSTDMVNSDFLGMAQALSVYPEAATHTEELDPALSRSIQAWWSTVIEL